MFEITRTTFDMLDDRQHLHQREHGRDRLKQLRAFCHAARLGNISRAAERILSSQPAVSAQVRTLEEELGVQLFRRHGPRIYLTQVGRDLYKRAMPLVQGMDRLPDTFAEEHHGDVGAALKIGAGKTSAAYLLPEYLERFRSRYPRARIEIRTGTGQQRIEWLRDYELDLVIAAVDTPPADVDFHPVLTSEPVLITARDHALARRESVAIEDIAAYPFIGHASTHYIRQVSEMILRLHGVAADVVVEVDDWGVIANYVAAGVGISIVPEFFLSERDRIERISLKGVIPPRRYGAMTRRDGLLGVAGKRFLRMMVAEPPNSPAVPQG